MCHVFCFFKQKTAYEMRISDWSSDVCSSDLTVRDCPIFLAPKAAAPFPSSAQPVPKRLPIEADQESAVCFQIATGACSSLRFQARCIPAASLLDLADAQIGRASGRERVCKYV